MHTVDNVFTKLRVLLLEWLADMDIIWNGLDPIPIVNCQQAIVGGNELATRSSPVARRSAKPSA
jgi:hypothetical protein